MNEHDLKSSMRDTMANATVPPPMSETPVLEAGRRAKRRRRAGWAGAGSVAAVVAIAVGVVIVAPNSGDENPGLGVGVQTTETQPTEPQPTESVTPGEDTKTSWPNGQTDRTATSGPRADQGVRLITELDAAVPAGFGSPEDLKGTGELAGAPMWHHQAQYEDTVDGVQIWDYLADVAVTKGDGVGRLYVNVVTPGNPKTGQGCELLRQPVSSPDGTCTEVEVDGKRVGVTTLAGPDKKMIQFDEIATYRHDDGTVVSVSQATFRAFTDFPPLAAPIFTTEQLAELATDPRFRLD